MGSIHPVGFGIVLALAVGVGARAGDLLPAERPVAEAVDHYLGEALRRAGVDPEPVADDATLVRRLTLDLAGRIPTAAEAREYVDSTDPEKRIKLVDRLMGSPGFVRHQAAELDALLMANARDSLRDYLVRAVGENRPWDRVFRDLMLPDQADPAGKPAAAYLRARVKDLDRLTTDVSATFFGVNISCAQCHDHPLVSDWKQDHFYGLKAFFNRTFQNGEFLGERGYGAAKFKTVEGLERQARMMFLSGKRVADPGPEEPSKEEKKAEEQALDRAKKDKVPPPPPKFSARAALVEAALTPGDREFFARSVVNRVWNRLFGRGLVMPLDQMHSANPPSHPGLLAWLSRDTAEHGYDLRRLVRGLVLSRAYARDSRWEREGAEAPRASLFAVAAVRPLTPSQLAASLRVATADPASFPADLESGDFQRRVASLEESARPLAALFTSAGGDGQIGVSESLLFSNGEKIARELLSSDPDRLVGRLKGTADPDEVVDLAVRNILSRPPDADETRLLGAYLRDRTDRPEEARRQVVWALLTCAEFRFNH